MKSVRPAGGRAQDHIDQLWAMAFYPERGVASRPFHLPVQRHDVAVLHAPTALTALTAGAPSVLARRLRPGAAVNRSARQA